MKRFEELDWKPTPIGDISLRRRREPTLDVDVYEVLLGEEYLMSSLFTVAEIELARLGLAAVGGADLEVVVGGLGLGYTAGAALEDPRVTSVHVVEALGEVIGWHQTGLLPLSAELTGDARCRLVHADFFALAAGDWAGLPLQCDAILVDIDHSPKHLLDDRSSGFYTDAGLRRLAGRLRPGGVFALWSDDPPDGDFTALLGEVFDTADAHVVRFANPLTGGESANTVYVATASSRGRRQVSPAAGAGIANT